MRLQLPRELRQIAASHPDIDWRRVITSAVIAELSHHARQSIASEAAAERSAVRHRLLATHSEAADVPPGPREPDAYYEGYECGEEWAKHSATFAEAQWLALERVGYTLDDELRSQRRTPQLRCEWLAWEITRREFHGKSIKEFWQPIFGADAEQLVRDADALRGFCCGARKVVDEAELQLNC